MQEHPPNGSRYTNSLPRSKVEMKRSPHWSSQHAEIKVPVRSKVEMKRFHTKVPVTYRDQSTPQVMSNLFETRSTQKTLDPWVLRAPSLHKGRINII
ncbi:hypothetical protein CEXT_656011 [Caerostris extrusa]|uniref:Uncharacterized protein n=1 Tax=Caerostris extrusa TaxID=172846 RepID=A0AAV4XRX7_CAEEX|nr:hypothetical protein CEXT_656011 [Caerostris extrusa]